MFILISVTGCVIGGIDLVFALDSSISIRSEGFNLIKDFVKQISRRLVIGLDNSLVGVILFGDDSRIAFNLPDNTNETELTSAIDRLRYLRLRGTNTHTALELLQEGGRDGRLGLRDGRPHVAIIVTDGRSTNSRALESAARALHAADIYQVYAAGVGDRVDESELQLIASDDSLVFTIDTFDFLAIQQLQDRISEQLCGTQCKYNTVMQQYPFFSTLLIITHSMFKV